MPINEAGGHRPSNLTKEHKRQAEAAIYGLSTETMSPQTLQFSPEEIERMRSILEAHDAQNGKKGIREFDLNNPPKVPYVHQDFPAIVYDHENRRHKVVANAKEKKDALLAGWKDEAYPRELPEEAEPALDEAELAEVARLDRIARKPRKPAAE